MKYVRDRKLKSLDADRESEKAWAEGIKLLAYASLLPKAKSVSVQSMSRFASFANIIAVVHGSVHTS